MHKDNRFYQGMNRFALVCRDRKTTGFPNPKRRNPQAVAFNGDPSETDAKNLVAEIMSKVIVKSIPRGVETGLYWKEPEQSGAMVEGSQRRVCASLQSGENGTLLAISDDAFDLPEELLRDLLAAFYQMRPISMHLKPRAEMPLTDLLTLALGPWARARRNSRSSQTF